MRFFQGRPFTENFSYLVFTRCFSLLARNGATMENGRHEDGVNDSSAASMSVLEEGAASSKSLRRNTGSKLFVQKWRAMFVKRFLNFKRYKKAIVTQVLMPSFWTLMAMVVAKTFPQPTDSPARTMTAEMFKANNVPFSDIRR